MARAKPLVIGDLVSFQSTVLSEQNVYQKNYSDERKIGMVVDTMGKDMVKVQWVSKAVEPCWYQRKALRKLDTQKSLNFCLTYFIKQNTLFTSTMETI
jgi:hypothetical protein